MKKWIALLAVASLSTLATGCSTWNGMSRSDKGAVIGAGAGAVVGSNLGVGSLLNTVGGAAVGGLIGHEVAK